MSQISQIIPIIDTHTAGEPTRVILRCPWKIPGETMEAKRSWFEENCRSFTSMVISEPRGHHDMFGAVLLDPVSKDADFGVFFLENEAPLSMCVHGSIGVAAALFKMGFPGKKIAFDTPSGLVFASLVSEEQGTRISIRNVPSFLVETVLINFNGRKIEADIAFGGNLFALVRAGDLKLTIELPNISTLIEVGMYIKQEVNKLVTFRHPILNTHFPVNLIEIYDENCNPPKNVVIFGRGQVDRSPCGTGTSAKLATLYAKGEIGLNQSYRYQSILNTEFQAKAIEEEKVGPFKAIIPEIQGEAFLTAFQFLVLEKQDPFPKGFDLY